jgi:hypothetical protein
LKRFAFARKYRGKTKAWWLKQVQAHIDGKKFCVYLNGKWRLYAARHATYGAYRSPGKGLAAGYVKPKKTLKQNTGARSANIIGGIGKGRCLMWHQVPGGRWCGESAVDMYTHLSKQLRKHWPGKRQWSVLEDNDPTGFRSNVAIAAKKKLKIEIFRIPTRSPDLSVMDYAVWKEINKRMRKQELKWAHHRKETREQYCDRLRTTARNLPKAFIDDSIGSMVVRCQRLFEAKGGYFEEGGL